nr:unnamed protein product [Callosobruchus analis]
MQHYAIFLQSFNYDIKYKNTKLHGNAHALSRLPQKSEDLTIFDEADVFEIQLIETLPVTVKDLAKATKNDSSLRVLLNALESGCIMKGQRVVIPLTERKRVLEELHSAHLGIVKMKNLARSYCWWPRIDTDIERIVSNCYQCNKIKNNTTKVETHIWEKSKIPFERVHADFAGPFNGGYYFILVDSFTKWPEIHFAKDTSSETTIEICRKIFSTFGIPKYFVTDNGSNFVSFKFKRFLQENGITAKLTAPYHPATNGQAERYVQTLKKALRTMKCDNYSKNLELCKFLLQYRRTPHIITGKSPSELMFGRQIRSRLDWMKPEINDDHVTYNTGKQIRELELGTRVAVRDYLYEKWKFGFINKRIGKLHYTIELDDGRTWKRHIDQIRLIGQEPPTEPYLPEHDSTNRTTNTSDIRHEPQNLPNIPTLNTNPNIASSTSPNNTELPEIEPLQTPEDEPEQPNIEDVPPVMLRRSSRVRKAPVRLDL